MTHLFNGALAIGAAFIASVGLIGAHSVQQLAATYEVDAYELASFRCDHGSTTACNQLAALEAE